MNMKPKPRAQVNCLLDSLLSPEEEMFLSLSDCIPKRQLRGIDMPNFIIEYKQWLQSGGNHFEFFFNIKTKYITDNKNYVKKNDNYEYWFKWRIKQLSKQNNVSLEDAELIFENNKLKKANSKAAGIAKKESEVKANKIKKEQTYAKYEDLTFPDNVSCVVIDYLNDSHKEYETHIQAAKDIGMTCSGIVNIARTRGVMKKKYCVVIYKGIRNHNRKHKDDDNEVHF